MRIILALALFAVAFLSGCAVGKTQSGQIVLGIEAGQLAETTTEAASMLAGLLPPPFGTIATGAVALLAGWGTERRARSQSDKAWDESQRQAERAEALRRADLLTPAPVAATQPTPTGATT